MKSTKKREIGLGDNLYGIPLDDILTPEQLEHMRQNPPTATKRERRYRKPKTKKFDIKQIKLPEVHFTRKILYIIGAVAAVLILLLIFKNPIAVRLAPKLYVSEAMEETMAAISHEADKIVDGIFGFDALEEKELTVTAEAGVSSDSYGNISNLSMKAQTGYSKKNENATAKWHYLYGGEEIASSTIYLNNDEIGLNIPQLFGEYWVAPAESFGKEWNESGLRKALYAGAIGEDADLSFSNLFGEMSLLSPRGMKEAAQLTEKLMSSAIAKYDGKTEIAVNGESKLARNFRFSFAQEDIREYLSSMMQLVLNDAESKNLLSAMNMYDDARDAFEDLSLRIAESIHVSMAWVDFAEYKGKIMAVTAHVGYLENGVDQAADFCISSERLKNMIDSVRISYGITGGGNQFAYSLYTSGNHTADGKVFTDTTTITTSTHGYTYTLDSNITLNFKEGQAYGKLTGTDIYTTKTLSYGGTCSKKGGLKLELTNVNASTTGNAPRVFTGNARLSVVPDMIVDKINPTNKRMILDYSKAEAENYLMRLEETDNVKNFLSTIDSIFNR